MYEFSWFESLINVASSAPQVTQQTIRVPMGYPLPGMQLHVVAGGGGGVGRNTATSASSSTSTAQTTASVAASVANAGAQQYAQYARHQSAQRAYAYPVAPGPAAIGDGSSAAPGKFAIERGVPEGAVASGRPSDSVLSPTTGPAAATSGGGGGAADGPAGVAAAAGVGPAGAVFYAMNV